MPSVTGGIRTLSRARYDCVRHDCGGGDGRAMNEVCGATAPWHRLWDDKIMYAFQSVSLYPFESYKLVSPFC